MCFVFYQTEPLLISYVVQDQSYTFLRQLKMVEDRRIVANSGNTYSDMTHSPFSSLKLDNNHTKDTGVSHIGINNGQVSPNGVSIHIKHKDGKYHVTSPKDIESHDPTKYHLQPPKKKRGRPPKRPPTGVVATQRIKKSKKDFVLGGFNMLKTNVSVDKLTDNKPMASNDTLCEQQPLTNMDTSCLQDIKGSSLICSDVVGHGITEPANANGDTSEHVSQAKTESASVAQKAESFSSTEASASSIEVPQQAKHQISEAVNIPVSQPVLQSYPVQTHINPQSQGIRTNTDSPQQLTGNQVAMVNSSYQVLTQVPNMVPNNGVLGTSGIIPGNQASYTVSCMPMAMPKIKRKRGRPPKNRSLVGFPGRCSPMPRHFGIPGSPMYALVKKKRGRPPKRKVGLPPVLVVPQPPTQSTVQVGRNVQLAGGVHITNTPVYVDSNTGMRYIQSSNGMTYINTGNNVQYSAGGGAVVNQFQNTSNQASFQPQTHQPTVLQNNNTLKPDSTFHKKVDITAQMAPVDNLEGKHPDPNQSNSNNAPGGVHIVNITPIDSKLEQECDDTSLISQDVVGDIINKLSDDRSNSATPLSSATNLTVSAPSNNEKNVIYSSSATTQLTTVTESNRTVSAAATITQSKANVSPFERQFENFLQRTKASPSRGQEINLSESSVSAEKDSNIEPSLLPKTTIPHGHNVLPLKSDSDIVMKESSGATHHSDDISLGKISSSSLTLPTGESNEHKQLSNSPTSNPTSPYSDTSHNKDGTPNSKRSSLSSSDLKEQKRHNLNKLTEKLHSIGEKKRPSNPFGVPESNVAPTNSPGSKILVDDTNNGIPTESQQRKSVISTLESSKTSVDGVIITSATKSHEQKLWQNERQTNPPVVYPRHNVILQSSVSQTLQGTVPRAAHSVVSLPPTSVSVPSSHVGYTRLVSNGYLHSMSGVTSTHANSQTVLPIHSSTPFYTQDKIIDSKTGLIYQPKGGVLPQTISTTLQNGPNDQMKMTVGKNNASKRMVAQKKKQVALQRLNGKNKGTQPSQGPFYVGVNVFNCPYVPQENVYRGSSGQKAYMYSNNGQVKGSDKKVYNFPVQNGIAEPDTVALATDKPLDFSLKKSK